MGDFVIRGFAMVNFLEYVDCQEYQKHEKCEGIGTHLVILLPYEVRLPSSMIGYRQLRLL